MGLEVRKSSDVARSGDRSASVLRDDLIVYAATDAYVSYLVGDELLGGNQPYDLNVAGGFCLLVFFRFWNFMGCNGNMK